MKTLEQIGEELQGYDPQALRASDVNAFLAKLVEPVRQTEMVSIFAALDRVLAQDVVSPISVPPHDNSAMDGFAFDGAQLREDAPLALKVIGTAFAGKAWQGAVGPGECVKIMTGAIMPTGLDTVVPQEFTTVAGDSVTIPAKLLQRGDNRRTLGEDLMAGRAALSQGTRLSPAACGLLASLGIAVPAGYADGTTSGTGTCSGTVGTAMLAGNTRLSVNGTLIQAAVASSVFGRAECECKSRDISMRVQLSGGGVVAPADNSGVSMYIGQDNCSEQTQRTTTGALCEQITNANPPGNESFQLDLAKFKSIGPFDIPLPAEPITAPRPVNNTDSPYLYNKCDTNGPQTRTVNVLIGPDASPASCKLPLTVSTSLPKASRCSAQPLVTTMLCSFIRMHPCQRPHCGPAPGTG